VLGCGPWSCLRIVGPFISIDCLRPFQSLWEGTKTNLTWGVPHHWASPPALKNCRAWRGSELVVKLGIILGRSVYLIISHLRDITFEGKYRSLLFDISMRKGVEVTSSCKLIVRLKRTFKFRLRCRVFLEGRPIVIKTAISTITLYCCGALVGFCIQSAPGLHI